MLYNVRMNCAHAVYIGATAAYIQLLCQNSGIIMINISFFKCDYYLIN